MPLLQTLGLSLNEAKIYQALITYGGNTVSTISLRAKVHRRNVYDSLNRLVEKGLVYRIFSEAGETVYEAVEPGKLMEFIEEKERQLKHNLPAMVQIFNNHRVPQRAFIYRGYEGVKNYLRDILKIGEDIYSIGGKGILAEPNIRSFVEWFQVKRKNQKQKHYHIWDYEVEAHPPVPLGTKGRYKFMPKEYTTNSTMDIFGDHIIMFSGVSLGKIEEDVIIFVIVSPPLAEAYRTWWKMMWDLLPEPDQKKKRVVGSSKAKKGSKGRKGSKGAKSSKRK